MEIIDAKQKELIALDAIMRGDSLHKAGKKAGYKTPSRDLANIWFDQRAAQYCHRKTKGKMILQGAPAAYDFMFRTMQDERADMRLRVRCAEFILVTAGHVPPKATDSGLLDDDTKDAKDMTVKELDAMLARIQAIKEKRAENATIIDVTPAPAKQTIEDMF